MVARLSNDVLRGAVDAVSGPGAILDVADLAAPSVVEAVLSRNAHQFATAGLEFVVWGARGAVRRDFARDLRRPGTGGGDAWQELTCTGRCGAVSGTGSAGLRRRLDLDDRSQRRIGSPRDQRACPDRDALSSLPGATRNRRRAGDKRRREPDAFPLAGIHAVTNARLGSLGALHLPAPADVVILRPVFRLRDNYQRGLWRFQLRPTNPVAATFRCRVDVRRRDRYRHPCPLIADMLLSRRFVHTAGLRRARRMRDHVVVVGLGSVWLAS